MQINATIAEKIVVLYYSTQKLIALYKPLYLQTHRLFIDLERGIYFSYNTNIIQRSLLKKKYIYCFTYIFVQSCGR